MAKDDALYRRAFRKAAWEKKQKAKKQGQSNSNLGRQWDTNLSAQYDNDGNPKKSEVKWSTSAPFVGH
jgi:hypothetical protein